MNPNSLIYIAGHTGMVGSALLRKLKAEGFLNLITRSHTELDLTRQSEVEAFMQAEKPEYVFLAAAKVGGILANNTYPAEFIYNNLAIQTNIIHAAWKAGVKRLLFLGSSCIYPRDCYQPMKEEFLLTGPLEPTNEPYAVAKIAGIKMCQSYNRQYGTNYIAVMPTNLYGPNDNFDLETSHVLPAMIRKFHLAKLAVNGDQEEIKKDQDRFGSIPEDIMADTAVANLWGSGIPFREFLHVDDVADACVFIMDLNEENFAFLLASNPPALINIGSGREISIKDLALLIKDIVGFEGDVVFDKTRPDGTLQKLLDVSRLTALGWKPKISLKTGIRATYDSFKKI
ncbi:MAG: GDP-L-fucose synthase [Candidatus Desulfaltia sp.]|nr:GDP-L-fucose synthase [Candidatus Desulfaltia sp.]